jgi:hypothetical protein
MTSSSCGGLYFFQCFSVFILDSQFEHNSAATGAGICVEFTTVSLQGSSCLFNDALVGGCIDARYYSTVNIKSSNLSMNSASYPNEDSGGAVIRGVLACSINVQDSVFENNTAAALGGCLVAEDTTSVTVVRSTFVGNSAPYDAGCLYVEDGKLFVNDSRFELNFISGDPSFSGIGAAILGKTTSSLFIQASSTIITNSSFVNQFAHPTIAATSAAAVFVAFRPLMIDGCLFKDNVAWLGAAVTVFESPEMIISNSTFLRNVASQGGAVLIDVSQTPVGNYSFQNNVFEGNSISGIRNDNPRVVGAGILFSNGGGTLNFINNRFEQNFIDATRTNQFSAGAAAAVFVTYDANITLVDNLFQENSISANASIQAVGIAFRLDCSRSNTTFVSKSNTFYRNRLIQSPSGAYNINGAAMGLLYHEGTGPSGGFIRISNTSFIENYANLYPAMFLSGVDWILEDSRFERNKGESSSESTAFVAVAFDSTNNVQSGYLYNNTFEGNIPGSFSSGLVFTDLAFRAVGNCQNKTLLKVYLHDNNKFKSSDSRPGFALSNIILRDCASITPVSDSASPSEAFYISSLTLVDGALLDSRNTRLQIRNLILTTTNDPVDPRANQILIGDYDVELASNNISHTFRSFRIVGNRGASAVSGRLILEGFAEFWSAFEREIYNIEIDVIPGGSLRTLPDLDRPITLDGVRIVVANDANIIFNYLHIPTAFIGFRNSTIEMLGGSEFYLSAGDFTNVSLVAHPNSTIQYLITNYWPISTAYFTGKSATFLGDIRFNFTFVDQLNPPEKSQIFRIFDSSRAGSPLDFSGASFTAASGYVVLPTLPPDTSDLNAVITNFYPASMEINDAGDRLDLIFPLVTNAPVSRNCSSLFDSETLRELSDAVECAWTSSRVLAVRSTQFPNQITIPVGSITDTRNSAFDAFVPSRERVKPPKNALSPIIQLAVPSEHAPCSSLTLDASNSLHLGDLRRASFRWGSTNTTLDLLLGRQNSSRAVIPAEAISAGLIYLFSLNLTNSYGKSSFSQFSVRISSVPILRVFIDGPPARSSSASEMLKLYGLVDIPDGCSLEVERIGRNWSISGPLRLPLPSLSNFDLTIPPNTMIPGSNYTFSFTAWPGTSPDLAITRQVLVTSVASPLSVDIVGDTGAVNMQKDITISASIADPDGLVNTSTVLWRWSIQLCPGISSFSAQSLVSVIGPELIQFNASTQPGALDAVSCLAPNGSSFNALKALNLYSAELFIPAGTFSSGELILSVLASDYSFRRSVGALVYINLTSSAVKALRIRTPTSSRGKILPQEKLIISACLTNECTQPVNTSVMWRSDQLGLSLDLSSTYL